MKLAIPSCIALLLLIASGIHRSSWSGLSAEEELELAWTRSLDDADRRLNEIPEVLGPWRAVIPAPEDENSILGGMGSYLRVLPVNLTRTYENVSTGEKVFLVMFFGKARQVRTHSFNDAYTSTGYSLLSKPEPITVSTGTSHTVFRTCQSMKVIEGEEKGTVRIFWAWSEGEAWEAPEYPRIAFEEAAGLYKMYVFTPIDGGTEDAVDGDHPAVGFIEAFLSGTLGKQARPGSPE